MKSIKPGRGPSGMGVIMGIAAAAFGVFWLIIAVSIGAYMMIPFGLIFIVIAVSNTVYNYKNATGKNRYSSFDIVDSDEEPDPLDEKYGNAKNGSSSDGGNKRFCPYCGETVDGKHKFCGNCGSKRD